jgi:phosphoglycolate phosphatase-like HAD superfamily hydrolase/HD superfamily phosphodiesterase
MIKVILFDWGDTVMRVFPQFHGAMADWPKVEAVPGIKNACENLSQNYRLYLATNASDSGSARVKAALSRVELDEYFSGIFTARDLGTSKPSTSYFGKILLELGLSPEEVLMVGDDFQADILGTYKAGMRSIWYLPDGATHTRYIPVQSGEIQTMDELIDVVRDLDESPLPTLQDCLALLNSHANDSHLLLHSRMVALAAYLMAELCRENGSSIDPILTHRGGLLHDLDKLICITTGLEHGFEGNRILQASGYPKIGRIALSHPAFTLLDPVKAPSTLEEKIVYLSDKLVDRDKIIGLDSRIANLTKRYPQDRNYFDLSEPLMRNLQNELLSLMKLDELKLTEFLNRRISLME